MKKELLATFDRGILIFNFLLHFVWFQKLFYSPACIYIPHLTKISFFSEAMSHGLVVKGEHLHVRSNPGAKY